MGKKDTGLGGPIAAPTRLSALDVQQKEFRVSRFGGYKMRDVDEFLDQITDTFTALTAEVERLRAGGAGPVVGSPDLDDVARQADEIIARARAEASRITAEARAAGPVGGSVGDQDRAAVSAFIDRERSFLQSLAGLVQEHAETVKGMAKSARHTPAATRPAASQSARSVDTPPPAATESPSPSPAPAAAPVPLAPTATEPASRPEPTAPTAPALSEAADGATEAPQPTERPTRVPESEATVRIEEPAPASASASAGRGEGDAEGDRSLRELFWGED
jgi:DivIVA domain-containing protein